METAVNINTPCTSQKRHTKTTDSGLLAEAEALLAKGDRMIEADTCDMRQQLGSVPEYINLSYVASHYFGKSRTWLYQRINGNKVNGKTALFTRDERRQLEEALHGIAARLLDIHLV